MIALSAPIVARIAVPKQSNDAAIGCSIRISSLVYSATCVSTILAQGEPCRCPRPKSRQDYWLPKLQGNRKHDGENSWRERQIGDQKRPAVKPADFLG